MKKLSDIIGSIIPNALHDTNQFRESYQIDRQNRPLRVFRNTVLKRYKIGQVWLDTECGTNPSRCFVISIPKSGTNALCVAVEMLGFHLVRVHPLVHRLGDWRCFSNNDVYKYENEWFDFELRLSEQWIHPGQLVASHIQHTTEIERIISRFRAIFIRRDLRDAVTSHMRHVEKALTLQYNRDFTFGDSEQDRLRRYTGSIEAENFVNWAGSIHPWANTSSVFQIRYEDLTSIDDLQATVEQLCEFLDVSFSSEILDKIRDLRQHSTVTLSPQRSDFRKFWSDEAEEWYEQSGLQEINKTLGYC